MKIYLMFTKLYNFEEKKLLWILYLLKVGLVVME